MRRLHWIIVFFWSEEKELLFIKEIVFPNSVISRSFIMRKVMVILVSLVDRAEEDIIFFIVD